MASNLALAARLPREDPRDALVSPRAKCLADLPQDAAVGTSSPRRSAQLLHARPDLRILPLRGNVETRLKKLEAREVEATLLAMAGVKRLGLAARITAVLEPHEMLPAAAQGAIGAEIRGDDEQTRSFLAAIDDAPTAARVSAECAVLAALGGSCRTPIAAPAEIAASGDPHLRAMIPMRVPSSGAAPAPASSRRLRREGAAPGRAQGAAGAGRSPSASSPMRSLARRPSSSPASMARASSPVSRRAASSPGFAVDDASSGAAARLADIRRSTSGSSASDRGATDPRVAECELRMQPRQVPDRGDFPNEMLVLHRLIETEQVLLALAESRDHRSTPPSKRSQETESCGAAASN